MPRLLTAKLIIAICVLASLLAGCGGSNTEDAAPTPVPVAQEEQSSSSEPADAADKKYISPGSIDVDTATCPVTITRT